MRKGSLNMKKEFLLFLFCFGVIAIMHSQTQNEFILEKLSSTSNTIQSSCKEDGHRLATVEFFTAIKNVEFETVSNNRIVSKEYDEKRGSYILCLRGVDKDWRYIQIDISKNGFMPYPMEAIQIKNGEYMAYKLSPKNNIDETPLEKLARITVYDKDNKLLVGAVVKNKMGKVYGSTRYDGTLAINFENKGETANVIISHPFYSDSKEITVQAGTHDYKVYLRNYSPPKNPKPPRVRKCKPEKYTLELSAIGGSNLGVALDFTASYFLIGFGVDWMILAREQTVTTSLVNSGYTGNFTKATTMSLSGSRTNVFLDLGTYFKYFSLSCQVGMLKTTVNRSSLYNGWGYGLVDGDLNEYWGSYEQRSFTNSTSDEETHLTITPQVKGYIPVGGKKTNSLSIGLGYTIIPSLNYNPGLSGSLGVHFRF